jgi:hypothetical protein
VCARTHTQRERESESERERQAQNAGIERNLRQTDRQTDREADLVLFWCPRVFADVGVELKARERVHIERAYILAVFTVREYIVVVVL